MGAGFCSLYQEIHYFEVHYIKVLVYYLKLNNYYFYKMINIFCVFKRKTWLVMRTEENVLQNPPTFVMRTNLKPKWIRILTFVRPSYYQSTLLKPKLTF